ncbi:DUF1152 domain-containing protein [Natribaculum luteum]|uniref:DUF1152 domain-containing protein n=1 Tax=Natribaculum luteum TaxID=1586232 RepID=A0ABD5NYQ4_9EURY|nr:DUF1152 domain-containing protein [Natribaculum luteum]
MNGVESLEDCFEYDAALVFGIGGSGDVVGSVPTARLLEAHGLDVLLGGVAWEPVPKDDRPGPRSFDEVAALERVSESVGLATGETRTHDGLEFSETAVARHLGEEVALVDISDGVETMTGGIDDACDRLGIDLVVGVDAGGDVLARGDEPGVRSPVTDGLGLVALEKLQVDACLGVVGYGSDGELAPEELEAGISRAADCDGLLGAWGITRRVRDELEDLLAHVETEASRVPVEAARGEYGDRTIRGGEVSLRAVPASAVTFYFEPSAVAATSQIAARVRGTESLEAAADALRELGLQTEFETEQRRLDSS